MVCESEERGSGECVCVCVWGGGGGGGGEDSHVITTGVLFAPYRGYNSWIGTVYGVWAAVKVILLRLRI